MSAVDADELVCRQDGAATKLRCAKCGAGICPTCLVRTAVGYKCAGCAGERPDTAAPSRGRRPAIACALAVTLFGAVLLLRPPGDAAPPEQLAVETPTEEAPATAQAMIGEEARDGQLVFVVEDFVCAPQQPSATGKICALRFNVKNASTSPAMLLGRFQYLADAQRRTYGADEAITRALPENANRGVTELNINPEVTVPLVFAYNVPDGVAPAEAQFKGTGRSRIGVSVRLERRA